MIFDIPFDLKLMEASNCLITATNRMGKSRLACGLSSTLQKLNWKVLAFDPCGNYKEISDIPNVISVNPLGNEKTPILIDESCIYDLSLLVPTEQKLFVNDALMSLWQYKVEHQTDLWHLILLEEMQQYAKNVRGLISQHLLRVMSAGRNQKMRVLGIAVDLALIDPAFIRLCQQRYHGKLGLEIGSKRRFKGYYGNDYMKIALEGLECGDFIYVKNTDLQIIHVPLFEPKSTPKPLPHKQPNIFERLFKPLS